MGILTIIGIVINLIGLIMRWFGGLGSGKAPSGAQMKALGQLKNATDKLDDHYRTYAVIAAPDDQMPKAEFFEEPPE